MGRATVIVIAFFFIGSCGGARPGGQSKPEGIDTDSVSMWVESEGSKLPIYRADGQDYLLGIEGMQYAVGVFNKRDVRIEAVVSVDGLDVITGQVADYAKQRGYVLMPGEAILVEGFRKSLDSVASFQFTYHADSYASRVGEPTNVGVIGVAVFEEKKRAAPVAIAAGDEAESVPAAPTAKAESAVEGDYEDAGEDRGRRQSVGTRYGDTVDSQAEIVPFQRRTPNRPNDVIALFYNDREGLERAGVVFPEGDPLIPDTEPNPFPGTQNDQRFAKPPIQ